MANQMSGTWFRAAIIWIVATLLMFPAFAMGHIVAYNSFLNVTWSEGFAHELFTGNLYPRWLPELNGGAGSPVFYFYGPFPFYLTAPFHLIAKPRFALLLGIWLMVGLSGQAFRILATNFVDASPALIASLAYMAMPYHLLVDIWVRADLGELSSYIFIPLCLLGIFRLADKLFWSLELGASSAGLVLSHAPTALLIAPFLIGICFCVALRAETATVLLRASLAGCLSLALTAAYVLPALLCSNMIHADIWASYTPSDNLLFRQTAMGTDIFLDAIAGVMAFITFVFAVGAIVSNRLQSIFLWTFLAAAVLFLVSPPSSTFWNLVPDFFDNIQFSWRGLILLDVAICMLFALMLQTKTFRPSLTLSLMLLAFASILFTFFVFWGRDGEDGFLRRSVGFENYLITTKYQPLEYLPKCRRIEDWERATANSERVVEQSLKEMTPDQLPVFYYPFLVAENANGTVIPASCDAKTGFLTVGRHKAPIVVEHRAMPTEHIGNIISLCAAAALCIGLYFSARRRGASYAKTEPSNV